MSVVMNIGTFKLQGKDLVYKTLEAALQCGYRAIDTAAVYRNEADIGGSLKELLPKFGLKREDIFITSKLGPKDQGVGKCRSACLTSINNLQTAYLDLYLIHWPGTQGRKPEDPSNVQSRMESWKDLEQLYKEGKLKAIGVSNYEQRHLDDTLSHCEVQPAVLQIEHHPHLVQKSLVEYCHQHNIHFQAYSSLGTTKENNKAQILLNTLLDFDETWQEALLLSDPTIKHIAARHGRTPAQLLLRWAVQQNIGVIPKSTNPLHLKTNIDIFSFKLSTEDMEQMNCLDSQRHYCWNPASVS